MHTWLARAVALVEELGDSTDADKLRRYADNMIAMKNDLEAQAGLAKLVAGILYRALARAELRAPSTVQGTFIPAGSPLEAFAAVGKALEGATQDVMFIDPYSDAKLLTDFAAQVPEGIKIRVLSDELHHKPTLKPAVERWIAQYGGKRPLEARFATTALHDRLVLVDRSAAWMSGQSFKDLAVKSPTSIIRVDPETAALKIAAYENMWMQAKPLT
jgi:hypothetical protein